MELHEFYALLIENISQSPQDFIAFGWFLFCWIGYSVIVDNLVNSSRGLSARMHLYRIQWMSVLLTRDNRVVDTNVIGSLQQSIAFFASTAILIIAGFLAVLGASGTAINIIKKLPFASTPSMLLWYMKVMFMISLFIYAFFKLTWALRQLNYCTILIGAMPLAKRQDTEEFMPSARRAAMVCTMAAKHMNRGLRTYYFSMAALSWFVNPWLMIIGSAWVVLVLYRREFRSHIVSVLNMPSEVTHERPAKKL